MRRQVIKREEYEAVPKVDTNETFGGQNIQTMSQQAENDDTQTASNQVSDA